MRASVLVLGADALRGRIARRVLVGLESDGVRLAGWLDWQVRTPRDSEAVWCVCPASDPRTLDAAASLFAEVGASALVLLGEGQEGRAHACVQRGLAVGIEGDARWSNDTWRNTARALADAAGSPVRFARVGASHDPGAAWEAARAAKIEACIGTRIGWVNDARWLASVPASVSSDPERVRSALGGSRRAMAAIALRARLRERSA